MFFSTKSCMELFWGNRQFYRWNNRCDKSLVQMHYLILLWRVRAVVAPPPVEQSQTSDTAHYQSATQSQGTGVNRWPSGYGQVMVTHQHYTPTVTSNQLPGGYCPHHRNGIVDKWCCHLPGRGNILYKFPWNPSNSLPSVISQTNLNKTDQRSIQKLFTVG